MFNKKVLTVIKRELMDKLFSKAFVISTLLIPVFMFGILGFQTYIMTIDGDSSLKLQIVSEDQGFLDSLKVKFDDKDFVKNNSYAFEYVNITGEGFDDYLNAKKKYLLSDSLTGIIHFADTAIQDKNVKFYSKNPANMSMVNNVKWVINDVLIARYFKDKNLSADDINYAKWGVDFDSYQVSETKEVKEENIGNRILGYLFSFLLYFSLIMFGTSVLRSVVEEKQNRIVEVLLSSVNAKELMTGKILGNAITGVVQMAIWLMPVLIVLSTAIFTLPKEIVMELNPYLLLYFLLNFFIGLVTFLGLFAMVGAIFDNDQDAQSGMWPLMLLIMIPFFITISMFKNPNNSLVFITSMAPFSSIIVMPARMTVVPVPLWQMIATIVINILTLVLIFPAAGKIYRVGILMTGKKPKLKDLIKWLKEKN